MHIVFFLHILLVQWVFNLAPSLFYFFKIFNSYCLSIFVIVSLMKFSSIVYEPVLSVSSLFVVFLTLFVIFVSLRFRRFFSILWAMFSRSLLVGCQPCFQTDCLPTFSDLDPVCFAVTVAPRVGYNSLSCTLFLIWEEHRSFWRHVSPIPDPDGINHLNHHYYITLTNPCHVLHALYKLIYSMAYRPVFFKKLIVKDCILR